jgi:hypothetical protein
MGSKFFNTICLLFMAYCFYLSYEKLKEKFFSPNDQVKIADQEKDQNNAKANTDKPKQLNQMAQTAKINDERKDEELINDKYLINTIEISLNDKGLMEIKLHQKDVIKNVSALFLNAIKVDGNNDISFIQSELNNHLLEKIKETKEKITLVKLDELQGQVIRDFIKNQNNKANENNQPPNQDSQQAVVTPPGPVEAPQPPIDNNQGQPQQDNQQTQQAPNIDQNNNNNGQPQNAVDQGNNNNNGQPQNAVDQGNNNNNGQPQNVVDQGNNNNLDNNQGRELPNYNNDGNNGQVQLNDQNHDPRMDNQLQNLDDQRNQNNREPQSEIQQNLNSDVRTIDSTQQ